MDGESSNTTVLTERPILRDIAVAAGVSKGTVSRILNDRPGVSTQLRKRVRKVADQMGYRPNPLVRAFHRGSSQLIGLYSRVDIAGLAFMNATAAVSRTLSKHQYAPVLLVSDGPQSEVPQVLRERYVDGLVAFEEIPPAVAMEVENLGIPCICALGDPTNSPYRHIRIVTVDPAASVRMALGHLLELGHRNIAGVLFGEVASDSVQKMHNLANPWTQSYLEAMTRASLPGIIATEHVTDVKRWVDAVFKQRPDVTAVVVQDVDGARALRKVLRERGLRVPQDVSVICTSQSGMTLDPESFTTIVEEPYEKAGQVAAEMILERIGGIAWPDWPEMRLLEPERVLEYGTTAPPRDRADEKSG